MFNVFISYAKEDAASAIQLCQATERMGVKCWIAPRDVLPGDEWTDAIEQALRNCTAIVVLVSVNSQKSIHVKREITEAITCDKRVFPYRIDSVPISGGFAYLLSTVQWVDKSRTSVESFAEQLKRVLEGRPAPVLTVRPKPQTTTAPEFSNLDELTRNRSRFSVRGVIARIFDDK